MELKPNDILEVSVPASAGARYPIFVGTGLIANLDQLLDFSSFSKIAVISDSKVAPLWAEKVTERLERPFFNVVIQPGEAHKSIASLNQIWSLFQQNGMDRHSLVLNLGGGLVGDLGGFAAATYMRGLKFLQIPTTLLAQVDASIGGKVGINFGSLKNMIGSFSHPQAVVVDVDTVTTQEPREFRSGFAEMIKHGLIADRLHFNEVAAFGEFPESKTVLASLIRASLRIKANIVREDEREIGPRKMLNFGHTVGHALESLALAEEKPMLHGEAISLGIVAESFLPMQAGLISRQLLERIEACLATFELPTRSPRKFPREGVLANMASDKKNSFGAIKWTLIREEAIALFDQAMPADMVTQALDYLDGKSH